MKVMYRTSWGLEIKPVEVVRQTKSSVFIMHKGKERRESDHNYFDSWDLAKESIVAGRYQNLLNAERQVLSYQKALEEAKELKPNNQ
jgi:hypothetical protein